MTTLNTVFPKQKAVIIGIDESLCPNNHEPSGILEKRLLEMGFVEGAPIMVLHEAPFTKDPIIIRLRNMRIALRRNEARCVLVRIEE